MSHPWASSSPQPTSSSVVGTSPFCPLYLVSSRSHRLAALETNSPRSTSPTQSATKVNQHSRLHFSFFPLQLGPVDPAELSLVFFRRNSARASPGHLCKGRRRK